MRPTTTTVPEKFVILDGNVSFQLWEQSTLAKLRKENLIQFLEEDMEKVTAEKRIEETKKMIKSKAISCLGKSHYADKDLAAIINELSACFPDELSYELTNGEKTVIRHKNQQAIGSVQETLNVDYKGTIEKCKTVKEAWTTLRTLASRPGTAGCATLLALLLNKGMDNSQDIQSYFSMKTQFADRLKSMNIPQLPNDTVDFILACCLIQGLDSSWHKVVSDVESSENYDPMEVMSLIRKEYHNRLLSQESKRFGTPATPALVASNEPSTQKPQSKCIGCKKLRHLWEKCHYNPKSPTFNSQRGINWRERDKANGKVPSIDPSLLADSDSNSAATANVTISSGKQLLDLPPQSLDALSQLGFQSCNLTTVASTPSTSNSLKRSPLDYENGSNVICNINCNNN